MKRGWKLVILLVLLGGAVTGYVLLRQADWDEGEGTPAIRLLDMAASDMAQLRWSYQGETCTLVQHEGVWSDPDDAALPVNQDLAVRLAAAVSLVESDRALGKAEDLEQYGLAQPLCSVEVTAAGGTVRAIALGDTNDLTGAYYALFDGEVYTVDDSIPTVYCRDRWSLIDGEEIPDLSEPSEFSVETEEGVLFLEKHSEGGLFYSDEYQWFTQTDEGLTPLDLQAVPELISALEKLDLSEVAAYDVTPEELERWGLTQPAATVRVSYGEEEELTLSLGAAEDGRRWARLAESPLVYRITEEEASRFLTLTAEELRPDEVCRVNINALTAFEAALDGRTCQIAISTRAAEPSDIPTAATTEYVYTFNGAELDSEAVRAALGAVYAMSGTGFAPTAAAEGESVLTLTYHWGEVGGNMTLTFTPYDADSYLLQRNGEGDLLCDKTTVESLLTMFRELLVT